MIHAHQLTSDAWQKWPRTFEACIQTYFKAEKFGRTGEVPADGNYMLAGLLRMWQTWQSLHGHHQVHDSHLDAAAAHEILYQHNRKRSFNRPAAALSACLTALVVERPERILDRHHRAMAKHAGKTR